MVYKIGVCDDEALQVQVNRLYMKDFLDRNGYEGKISGFRSYEKLMKEMQKDPFHILFLDIDFGEGKTNGITLAKQIYEQYPDVLLVFITGFKEFTAEAFEVEAMGYIVKPVEPGKLERILRKCILQVQAGQEEVEKNFLVVVEKKIKQKILLDKIIRIERKGRKSCILTGDREYCVNETISSLEERMQEQFLRISQSDLVNKKLIQGIEKDVVVLPDETRLKIGTTYRKSVKKAYFGEEK